MMIPADIHTHRPPRIAGEAIVNCFPEAFDPQAEGWYSVGIHPWYVASSDILNFSSATLSSVHDTSSTGLASADFEQLLRHPRVLAVGEVGLDKLAVSPLAQQIRAFELQALLAEEVDKPLIIHLVKAVDELLKLKRRLCPVVPWIIHGFRGKAALAEEYLRHGFYLSFGERYQEAALRTVPSGRLFIETDETITPVARLYERAAEIRGISPEELKENIRENVDEIFFKR